MNDENYHQQITRQGIPDLDIFILQQKIVKIGSRPVGVSRRNYVHAAFDFEDGRPKLDELNPDRRIKDITEEQAVRAKKVCGDFLHAALDQAREEGMPLSASYMSRIYAFATTHFGLSYLEAEELAPDNKEWLIFCIDPEVKISDSSYAFAGHTKL